MNFNVRAADSANNVTVMHPGKEKLRGEFKSLKGYYSMALHPSFGSFWRHIRKWKNLKERCRQRQKMEWRNY